MISDTAELPALRLLVASIRTFGGELSGCPFWVFFPREQQHSGLIVDDLTVEWIPIAVPDTVKRYPFGSKVFACAAAERMAACDVGSLVWLDPECLIVQPPVLYDLGGSCAAAMRPVHHRNVGIKVSETPDAFWEGIYRTLGIEETQLTVESFIDGETLHAYFNTHGFSLDPRLGIFNRWLEHFMLLISDVQYQEIACGDELHRVFLFQALLSAMIAVVVDRQRLRILPPTYNYPYHLHERVPEEKRAASLNALVSLTYEGRPIHPDAVRDIEICGTLREWIVDQTHRQR